MLRAQTWTKDTDVNVIQGLQEMEHIALVGA